jgi:hypothetical protein
VDVFCTDTLQVGNRLLGGPDGGELRDQVSLAGLVQGIELGRARMSQMVEVERVRNHTLHLLIYTKPKMERLLKGVPGRGMFASTSGALGERHLRASLDRAL